MKKYILYFLVVALLVACGDDEPEVVVTKDKISRISDQELPAEGGNITVAVDANCSWTVSKSDGAEWLTISQGQDSFTITALTNNTGKKRMSTLTVEGGKALPQVFTVSQPAVYVPSETEPEPVLVTPGANDNWPPE